MGYLDDDWIDREMRHNELVEEIRRQGALSRGEEYYPSYGGGRPSRRSARRPNVLAALVSAACLVAFVLLELYVRQKMTLDVAQQQAAGAPDPGSLWAGLVLALYVPIALAAAALLMSLYGVLRDG
jgi:hypothetical protein